MADAANLPSLTVLSGPLVGTQFVLEDAIDNVLLGSDPNCRFCLDVPGVSPIHARLWVDLAGITVYDTNSPLGVFVNDDRVHEQAPLRNGDVLWLGPPGDEASTMLQVRVPSRTAERAAPTAAEGDPSSTVAFMSPFATAAPAAEPEVVEPTVIASVEEIGEAPTPAEPLLDETVATSPAALAAARAARREEPTVIEHEPVEPEIEPTMIEAPVRESSPETPEEAGIQAEAEAASEGPNFDVLPESEPAFVRAFDDELTQALPPAEFVEPTLDSPEPTVGFALPQDPVKFDVHLPSAAVPSAAHAFEEDIEETMVTAHQSEIEPTVIQSPAAPPRPETPPSVAAPRVEPPPPARAAAAASPSAPSPRSSTPAPRSAPRPAAPTREVSRPPAARAAVPVAPVAPPPRADAGGGRSSGGGKGLVVGLGGLALVAAGVGAYFFLRTGKAPVPAPTTQAAALPPSTQAAETLPPVDVAPVEPVPEPTPIIEEEVTMVPGATPRPRPSPVPSPSGRPSAAAPRTAGTTPPAVTAPPAQAATAVRVAGLLGQAQSALSAGNHDVAIAHYDEVLRLDPQNAGAQQGRTAAVAARTTARKSFVTGRTVVQAGKAKADLSGFDTSDVSVQKAPDFSGRLEFSMSPSKPKPGEPYTLQIALLNDGKKSIKVSGMTVSTVVNGARSGGPMAPRVREVSPQQRVVLEALPGVWPQEVTSWSAEVQVTAGRDESLRGQVTWR